MDKHAFKLLDNPVWNALQTHHQAYATGTPLIQRYPRKMLPFLSCQNPATSKLNDIEPWLTADEQLFIVGEIPHLPSNWTLISQLECIQMVCEEQKNPVKHDVDIARITLAENEELIQLIHMVQPGYFFKDTALSGRYFGIKVENKLVAVAGERLRMPGFTEISAVCTLPSFTGKGYAQMLVTHLIQLNLQEGTIPFLHVLRNNMRAINVYTLLGFKERIIMPFRQLELYKF